MMQTELALSVHGETLQLLPERAALWPSRKTLIVADIHIGKAASFRSHGMPIPEGDTDVDLQRLTELITTTKSERLVIVGDLLHAASGKSPEVRKAVQRWREHHRALEVVLITGNHDRSSGQIPEEWYVDDAGDRLDELPMSFVHDPDDVSYDGEERLTICGHLHPGVQLAERRVRGTKAPCFWLQPNSLILPSFGTFTGSIAIAPGVNDRVFAVTSSAVIEVPLALLSPRQKFGPQNQHR